MVEHIAKLFALLLFSLFICQKILNIRIKNVSKSIVAVILSVALAYGVFLLKTSIPYGRFVIMIAVLGLFVKFMTGISIDIAFVGVILSTGISYGFSVVSTLVSAFILRVFLPKIDNVPLLVFSVVMQGLLIFFLFRIKRLRKGIPFLHKRGARAIGLIISGIILSAMTLIANDGAPYVVLVWLLISAVLCIAGLILWWRSGITNLYRERIKERYMREYEAMLTDKDRQIQALRESNDMMAKIIHRDNKLLPAMAEAVKSLVDRHGGLESDAGQLLEQIEKLICERTHIISQRGCDYNALPSTKNDLLDGVIKTMYAKAAEREIAFALTLLGDALEWEENSSVKPETLLADILENAIIATADVPHKRILVTLGMIQGHFEMTVQDSGIPFEVDTLVRLGTEQVTTHADEGGSGIGFMTTFEIMRECGAGLIIQEFEPGGAFSKSVTIRFDGKNRYMIRTWRPEDFPKSDRYVIEQHVVER